MRRLLDFASESGPTIGELAEAAKLSKKAAGLLSVLGLRIDVEDWDGFLLVADAHPALDAVFSGTCWACGWARSLLTVPDAQAIRKVKFRRFKVSAVAIPIGRCAQP